MPTPWTAETLWPAQGEQIVAASLLARKVRLEFELVARVILHQALHYILGSPESSGYPAVAWVELLGNGTARKKQDPRIAGAGPIFVRRIKEGWRRSLPGRTRWTVRERAEVHEWRRTSAIRPVVFEGPGVVTDDVVQLHLEHRIVQRLLSRFLAQGYVHHDLSRACLAQTQDAIPRVILLGRLALYGPRAARLHEEIIPVTARWTDPQIRKSELSPYARDTEARTVELLYESLVRKATRPIPDTVAQQLREGASRDVAELLPHLTSRGEEYARDAIEKLDGRAEAESKAMREILETQKRHIEAKVEQTSRPEAQLTLPGMNEEERRQLQDEQRYWQAGYPLDSGDPKM